MILVRKLNIHKKMYEPLFLVLLAACNVASTCYEKKFTSSQLDLAIKIISEAKDNISTCDNRQEQKPRDCTDVLQMGNTTSGVYKVWPINRLMDGKSLEVYCDMETEGGGWLVIQRRGNFNRQKDYFFKDWKSYKEGFGDIEKDFWLGNDNIFALTNQKLYSGRFDLKDVEQRRRYALYDTFWIDDENNQYTLHLSDYSGDAGDSMTKEHNNQKFSTKDRDNDQRNDQHCAQLYKGGWWYSICHQANLNGLYHKGRHDNPAEGVNWFTWRGYHDSLEWTEIKIRPKSFRLSTAINRTTSRRTVRPSSSTTPRNETPKPTSATTKAPAKETPKSPPAPDMTPEFETPKKK